MEISGRTERATMLSRTGTFVTLLCILSASVLLASPVEEATQTTYTVRVPNTTVEFELVRCDLDPDRETEQTLWVLKTEVPWELYDIFVYRLDETDAEPDTDGISRPSKPYVPPDRGFGHDGYPAMGMTRSAAEAFCEWLSESTGLTFRLPTESEWSEFAGHGPEPIDGVAWHSGNAEFTTHPVSRKPANAHGLHDTLGNVAEWVTAESRRPVAMGGSYRDAAENCTPTSKQQQERSWNASDPQIPKSQWWLADCSWVGFRFVTESVVPDEEEQQDDE